MWRDAHERVGETEQRIKKRAGKNDRRLEKMGEGRKSVQIKERH